MSGPLDSTLPLDGFENLDAGDEEPTRIWERPVFFGEPIAPYPAEQPLPARLARVVANDTTRSVRRRA